MGMQKTLGGDRLRSGKKIKVNLHGFERSTHDLGYIWRSTMSAGTLIPFMVEVALPGDTFDINLDCDIKTHPTIGPLFGSYKVQLDVFQAPIRLYNSLLHNNALGIGLNMNKVKFPQYELLGINRHEQDQSNFGDHKDIDNSQVNPSSIFSYLGVRGVGRVNFETMGDPGPGYNQGAWRSFNAIPWLAYWEIYKNYYSNKQEEIGAVIHTGAEEKPTVSTVEIFSQEDQALQALTENAGSTNALLKKYDWIIITTSAGEAVPNQFILSTNIGEINLSEIIDGFTYNPGASQYTGSYNGKFGNIFVDYWRFRGVQDAFNDKPKVHTFPLEDIDNMRKSLLRYNSEVTPFYVNKGNNGATGILEPYKRALSFPAGIPSVLASQEGLALKTYQSDLFNNWLQTEWIDGSNGINAITSIDTSERSFTLDTLNLSKKVYDMLNRIAVSGGSYDDWLDAVYDHDRYTRAESPIYCGGLSKELVFQEVVSNNTGDDPLGTLAGKGVLSKKHKGGHVVVKVDEPSYLIGIISLTPRVDYSQGNKWDVHLKTMDDLHKPNLDEIGFQELITEQMAWWDTIYDNDEEVWIQKSAGKQPAWINYMTNVNRSYGNFAVKDNEMFMTLNRRYEMDNELGIKDLTTYIDPSKFNFIFAETALDAQNFWAQIAVDITARRKMSAKVMPNL